MVQKLSQEAAVCAYPSTEDGPVQSLMGWKSVVQKLSQEAAVCAYPCTEDGPEGETERTKGGHRRHFNWDATTTSCSICPLRLPIPPVFICFLPLTWNSFLITT